MRKFKLFFACMLMTLFGVGQVWAADADVTYDFTVSGWSVSGGTLTNGTVSFTGSGPDNFKMNGGYFMMGKSGAYLTLPAYSKAVEKIVVTGKSGASASVGQNIFVGDNPVSTATTGATGSNTYEIASASQAAGTIYTLKVTSSHNTQVTKIEIFYVSETPGTDPDPTPDPDPTEGDVYELFSGNLEAGEYVICSGTNAMKNVTTSSPRIDVTTVSISDDKILNPDGSIVWKIEALTGDDAGKWTIYNEAIGKYAAFNSTDGRGTLITSVTDYAKWTTSGAYDFINVGKTSKNYLRYNNGYGFASYASTTGAALTLYKKSGGTPSKQASGLAYAAADQKKLTKYGEAFTAPTLANPNNLTVAYASNNTDVVEVAANGALTIKATGVATITASFDGNDDYQAGSASYTLGVTTKAGTPEDPYVAADVKIAIDAAETIEDAYATGLISNIVTTSTNFDAEAGFISFYFSADGLTSGQQIEAYKCYNVGGAKFTAVTDVETGATVVVKGTLKKYNSTYEFDQNCQLVSYEAPAVAKQSIANDQAHPYSVAQAIGYAADGVTYDLDDYVYVQGVVYDVKSFNQTNGTLDIYIKDANTDNQFELYKCAGINNGSSTTEFGALTDVKVGDIVIAYGQLTVYNTMSELKAGNYLADLKRFHTVRFWNSEGWDNVKVHVWNSNGDVTDWPGVDAQFADGWHFYEVEEGNSLLFHNNDGTQTVDINDVQANACYVLTGETVNTSLAVEVDNDCNDRFYVAGTAALTGDDWNTTADPLVNGSITFTNVPAGDHEFKITNGTWKWNVGAAAFDSENSNVTNWGTDNVGFTTTGPKDITITYDKDNNKIAVQAVDYVAPVEPEYRAIVVTYGDKHYAMTKTLDNKGFTPLEVTIDGEGNIVVPSQADSISIMWKFNEGTGTATFQDGENKYLAHKGTGTDLQLADDAEEWTLHEDGYYYTLSGRTFFYYNSANLFKNYSTENLGKTNNGYSDKAAFYAPDKVKVSTTAKLRFFAPVEWEDDVYAFTWEEGYSGNHQMTAVEEGSRWFECDLKKGVEFLVRKGNSDIWDGQTVNIPALDADKCYAWAPKDGDGKFTVATIASCEMNYYLAGDDALLGTSENQGWAPDARALNANNAITFNEVAANTQENPYKFKITNGTWDWNLGAAYVDADACEGVTILTTDDDGNVRFSLADESNVTITYNPATEKISIVASAATPKEYYTKVTSTDDITAGTYLIVYEAANVAFDGGLTTLDAVSNTIDVDIVSGNKIEVSAEVDAASFFLDPAIGTIKSASGLYIGVESNSNGLKQNEKIYKYRNTFSIDANEDAVIAADFEGSTMTMRYNDNSGQYRFRYFKTTSSPAIQLYKKAEAAKANPQLAFDQTAVEAIKGEDFTAPTLTNNHNVTVAYEAGNTKASVNAETGEVTLNNAGEVTIYAVAEATELFRESYAKYTITIKQYETIRENLTPGRYYTVCYDKTMKQIKGASLWSFNGKDANMAYIVEENLASYPAGTPYLIYAESDKLEAITEAVDNPEATSNNGLYGTLIEMSNTDLLAAGATHLLINNELRPLGNGYLKANRAYVILGEIPNTTPSNALGKRVRAIPMHQDAATGIDELNASEKPVKMVIDGQLYILRGEKMYDATGRLVK